MCDLMKTQLLQEGFLASFIFYMSCPLLIGRDFLLSFFHSLALNLSPQEVFLKAFPVGVM